MNYFSQAKQSFYNNTFFKLEDMPSDVVLLEDKTYNEILDGLNSGKVVSLDTKGKVLLKSKKVKSSADSEIWWVKSELMKVSEELDKIADGYHTTTATETEWRTYRNKLRDWPLHEHYPEVKHRPISPTNIKEV